MIRGAGRIARTAAHTVALPATSCARRQIQDARQENAAVDSLASGWIASRRAAAILSHSRRTENLNSARAAPLESGPCPALESAPEKAAQVEKRKKEQIRAFRKKKRQRASVAAKRGESVASAGGFVETANTVFSIPQRVKKAAATFISEHKGMVIGIAAAGILFILVALAISSFASVVQGSGTTITVTTYASTDADIYAAENVYCALEDALNAQVNGIESAHPGYSEYNYQIDEIEHNPYHLISYLQVKYGGFVYDDAIKAAVQRLFSQQYRLSISETSEIRTRMETVTDVRTVVDPETGEMVTEEYQYEQEVEYEHKILYAVLTNRGLDIAARGDLTAEEIVLYDALNRTYGNRSDLFDIHSLPGVNSSGIQYEIPPEALSDVKFANMIREAEKYLGYPYVWGGKSPRTSFDCSGFVCWVLNHCGNGWDVGQKRAKDLCRMCVYVSPQEARPGDLIFFEKTYNTTGASHVGIYVGEGMMIHCGNPIKYGSINTRYFKAHFLCFGRLPFYDN